MTCTFGMTPCPLVVLPTRTVMLSGRPKANITDFVPLTNIASFGMCSAPTNPAVIAATSAAMGVFTPAPCVPAISTPWIPGAPTILVQGSPAMTNMDRNFCMWLGQISFTNNGQIPIPPPICTPPPGKPVVSIPLRMPLSEADFSASGGGGGGGSSQQKQYKDDLKKAGNSGKQHDMMGNAFEKASKKFDSSGNDIKAAETRAKADLCHNTATDKNNQAIGDVNQMYRETLPPPKQQMAKLTEAQREEYNQRRESIMREKTKAYQEAEQGTPHQSKQMNDVVTNLKKHFANQQAYNALKSLNIDTYNQIKGG